MGLDTLALAWYHAHCGYGIHANDTKVSPLRAAGLLHLYRDPVRRSRYPRVAPGSNLTSWLHRSHPPERTTRNPRRSGSRSSMSCEDSSSADALQPPTAGTTTNSTEQENENDDTEA